MKFKIKKQLLNEAPTAETTPTPKVPPGAKEIKNQLGNVISYDKDPGAFDSPPIKDALEVRSFLETADDEVATALKTKFTNLTAAINKVIEDYKAAKTAKETAAAGERDAATNKEKEAQQAPMKKAIRTLVLFALDQDDKIGSGEDINFKFDNEKLIQYMDKVKEALKFVQEHELENLEEVRLMESTNLETLINKAFDNPSELTKIITIVKERIKSIEDAKAGRERGEADEKAKAEKFEKNKELLFKVLRFFQEKVGIESIRIPAYDRSNEVRSNKKIANLAKELRKDFPTFDTLYNFLDKIIEEIIEKLGDAIDDSGNLQSGASEASIRLYAELKTIAKKFRKTILKLLEFNNSWRQLPPGDRGFYGAPEWNLKTDGISKLWQIIDAVVSESKKYKLKLIENKRG